MFGEDGVPLTNEAEEESNPYVDKIATHKKYLDLKKDYLRCRGKSKNEYDYFNMVERSILGMEEDEAPGPD